MSSLNFDRRSDLVMSYELFYELFMVTNANILIDLINSIPDSLHADRSPGRRVDVADQ